MEDQKDHLAEQYTPPEQKAKQVPIRKTNYFGIFGFVSAMVSICFVFISNIACLIVGLLLSITGFVLSLLGLMKKNSGKGLAVAGISVASVFLLFGLIGLVATLAPAENLPNPTQSPAITDPASLEPSVAVSTVPSEAPAQTQPIASEPPAETSKEPNELTEDEYKTSCRTDIGYKDLLRNPDENVGELICVEVSVYQILGRLNVSGEWNDAYSGFTDNDGYGLYFGDQYLIMDARTDDDMKILENDILLVYGEFCGTKKLERTFTGEMAELPVIMAKYVELIDE